MQALRGSLSCTPAPRTRLALSFCGSFSLAQSSLSCLTSPSTPSSFSLGSVRIKHGSSMPPPASSTAPSSTVRAWSKPTRHSSSGCRLFPHGSPFIFISSRWSCCTRSSRCSWHSAPPGDLHTFAPSIVFIEHCDPATHACFALENTSFDTLAWFQRSPAFAAEWRNYHLQQSAEDFDVYARNPSSH